MLSDYECFPVWRPGPSSVENVDPATLPVSEELAAALLILAALNQLHRPWYVELQRQGLADAPRRVWRVQGWRRSGRLMGELTAAVREGRIDNERAVILLTDDRS